MDGRMLPLNTSLANAQVVDIVQARIGAHDEEPGPSRDWLNPALGFVRSNRARAKVRQWFNARQRGAEQAEGRERIEKLLAREGATALSFDELASRVGLESPAALFAAVARETLGLRALEAAIRGTSPTAAEAPVPGLPRSGEPKKASSTDANTVLVMGVDFLMTHLAKCCHPVPPDAISGFVTRGRGVSVHRRDCPSLAALRARSPERELAVSWGDDWQKPVKAKGGQLKVTDAVHVQLDPEKVEKLNREEKGKIQVQTGDARFALNSRIVQAEEGAAQIQESKKQMQTAQEAMAVHKEMTVSSLENLSLLFI